MSTDELTWGTRPSAYSWLSHELRLDRTPDPVDGYWRPVDWPVSNHVIRRPLRILSLNGPDEAALAALSRRKAEPLRLPAPSLEEERAQLATELAAVREFDTPAPEFDTPARESDIRRCRTRARCRGEATQIIRRALGQD